jgi:sulfate adenylyltransferase subunit 1
VDILKFITAGSVDDGKSTLIGRLLYDSKSILADQLEAIEKSTKNSVDGNIDLALLTDGLRAEREQGITIDVAYRYFATDKRKFIIADAPGHIQYTRNMITGASTVDLAIILIDARQGIIEQTKRHSIIASMLAIPHVFVAINKIDLVDYSEQVYNKIVTEYAALAEQLGFADISFFPVSALKGDNIVLASENTPWYEGKPLLKSLEEIAIKNTDIINESRFQVQYVIRPQTTELHDYRGYAGKISNGVYKKGDKVTVLPAGINSSIAQIEVGGVVVEEAFAPQSVTLQLTDDIDISRGDTIVLQNATVTSSNEIEALLCWLDDANLNPNNKYLLQHNSKTTKAAIKGLDYKLDVHSLEQHSEVGDVKINEIVKVRLKTASPLVYDSYAKNKKTGAAILVDETSNKTVAAVLLQ